jgi:hypothetical protein
LPLSAVPPAVIPSIQSIAQPTANRSARVLAVVLLVLIPPAFGPLALFLGQDTNWDLRNYHWYNAYAFVTGRFGFDMAPAQIPSFYNPTLDIPYFLVAQHFSARTAAFLLGTVQGLNFVLLFALGHRLLRVERPVVKVLAAAGIAGAGVLGSANIAQIGATFYDNVVSLGVLGGLLLAVVSHPVLLCGRPSQAFLRALAVGIPAGAAMGLKQPSVLYCVGLCFAFLAVPAPPLRRLLLAFFCGIGILAGIALTGGHWMWVLWQEFGNPLFPYFNHIFKSPLAAISDYRDIGFQPATLAGRLLLPFRFAVDPHIVGEITWIDYRIPVLYGLLPVAVLLRVLVGRRTNDATDPIADPAPARFVLVAVALSYATWVVMFCIYRYIATIEMLAPLALALTIGLLPLSRQARFITIALGLALIQATTEPGSWGRTVWSQGVVELTPRPVFADPGRTLIVMAGYQPMSYVIPNFPSEVTFVRVQSNFVHPDSVDSGYSALLRRRILSHMGDFFMLSTVPDTGIAADAATAFGLELERRACRTLHNNLGEPLSLCPAHR